MRLSLIIVALRQPSFLSKSPLRRKTVGGAPNIVAVRLIAGLQHFNNVWPPCSGVGGSADPIQCTSPRRDHIRPLGTRALFLLKSYGCAIAW